MTNSKTRVTVVLLAVAGFGLLYAQVLSKLVYDWANDGNYSHGFLIVPLAAYFVWERRLRLAGKSGQGLQQLLQIARTATRRL